MKNDKEIKITQDKEFEVIDDYPKEEVLPSQKIDSPDKPKREVKKVEYTELLNTENMTLLGKGGAGWVFSTTLDTTKIALKQYIPLVNNKIEYGHEKKIHLLLNHPNIIELYGYIEKKEMLYYALVMEIAEGNLQEYLNTHQNEARDPNTCKKYAEGIVAGVSYLHSQNIVHRDLKPSNVLISENSAKISDFGTCLQLNASGTILCMQQVGSAGYMPPEAYSYSQLKGLTITVKYDIRALAQMLLLLTLKNKTKPEPGLHVPSTASVDLQQIIHAGLNKKPEYRPFSEDMKKVVTNPKTKFR